MKFLLSAALVALLAGSILPAQDFPDDATETAARSAAEQLQARADGGEYGQIWDEGSTLFQKGVTREKWLSLMSQTTGMLGSAGKRNPSESRYMTQLPDVPAGVYAYFRYDTVYGKAGALQEHINLTEEGGKWKLTGYFVRPAGK